MTELAKEYHRNGPNACHKIAFYVKVVTEDGLFVPVDEQGNNIIDTKFGSKYMCRCLGCGKSIHGIELIDPEEFKLEVPPEQIREFVYLDE